MKLIIAGSRDIVRYVEVAPSINKIIAEHNLNITEVISGAARGVDTLGEVWAWRSGIKVDRKPADWDTYGRSAGPRRNKEMGNIADVAIVFILNNSRGSTHMANYMKELGKPVYVIHITR
jgi:predicted Rossmann fold nucleotide-binding protein DprA/Smf involved in DNA uptake